MCFLVWKHECFCFCFFFWLLMICFILIHSPHHNHRTLLWWRWLYSFIHSSIFNVIKISNSHTPTHTHTHTLAHKLIEQFYYFIQSINLNWINKFFYFYFSLFITYSILLFCCWCCSSIAVVVFEVVRRYKTSRIHLHWEKKHFFFLKKKIPQ